MNEVVDAVFGHPKHDLLKLIHRQSANDHDFTAHQQSTQSMASEPMHDATEISHQFKHDFQETSSLRPCTCAHCNGLVTHPL